MPTTSYKVAIYVVAIVSSLAALVALATLAIVIKATLAIVTKAVVIAIVAISSRPY